MGNKPVHDSEIYPSNLKNVYSDDSYLPMTKDIKRALIDGKTFNQVSPSGINLNDNERTHSLNESTLKGDIYTSTNDETKNTMFTDLECKTCGSFKLVVDSRNETANDKAEEGKVNSKNVEHNNNEPVRKPVSSTTSTSSTRFVQIDQKKSKFTMQLEERLRQSKLELGFDTDLDSLKEFVYKWDDTLSRKKSIPFKKTKNHYCQTDKVKSQTSSHARLNMARNLKGKSLLKKSSKYEQSDVKHGSSRYITSVVLDKSDEVGTQHSNYNMDREMATNSSSKFITHKSNNLIGKVSNVQTQEKESTKYSSHNCQILGLCSVGRPQIRKSVNTFNSNINNDLVDLSIDNNTDIASQKGGKHDKDYCDCELCKLAYLTDMGFPTKFRSPYPRKKKMRKPYKANIQGDITRNKYKERIRIVECGDSCKSVDISVNGSASCKGTVTEVSGGNSNCSGISIRTLQHDTKNEKIRRMFEQNNKSTSFTRHSNDVDSRSKDVYSGKESKLEPIKIYPTVSLDNNNRIFKKEANIPSSTTLADSITSSLSSVMSYKRVRILFEAIINKNKSRKRPRKNINKFKEMEELGLGKLENNRWYPSGNKTKSIWSNMHSKVNGVEAEFKRYPKTYTQYP